MVLLGTPAAIATPLPDDPACSIFPADNPWNQRVDSLPVAAGSTALVRGMQLTRLHPDFSDSDAEGYGIPFNVVSASTARKVVAFDYADESDAGPYPIPPHPQIEGGSDHHLLLLDRDACRLYELFAAARTGNDWHAGSGAIFELGSNTLRPDTWTSADAAGLPIFPGLARHDEVAAGAIDHALRVTIPVSQRAYLWPGRHYASSRTEPWLAPMALRLRIKPGYDISGYPTQSRIILRAAQRYGLIVADNGSAGFISGAPAPGWNDDDLHSLHGVPASAFEVVDTSSLPNTPRRARIWNRRFDHPTRSTARARFFLSRRSRVTLRASRNGRVVRRVRVSARQGYVQVRMRAVRGAKYSVVVS